MVTRTDNGLYRCYLVQILLILVAAVTILLWQGASVMLAVLYGGGITLLNTWLLARRVARAVTSEHLVAHSQVGVIERLCVAVVMIILGFVVLGLSPVGLIVGLAVPYCGFLFAFRSMAELPEDLADRPGREN
jgi:F0F1-type ATP synthase assembly protein I